MFRKRRKPSAASGNGSSSNSPMVVERPKPEFLHVNLTGVDGHGEAIINCEQGRVVVAAIALPEPWTIEGKVYSGYAAYLEDPGSGNRVRMDMVRASDRNWAAVKELNTSVECYTSVFICPVGDGAVGQHVLSGRFSA